MATNYVDGCLMEKTRECKGGCAKCGFYEKVAKERTEETEKRGLIKCADGIYRTAPVKQKEDE